MHIRAKANAPSLEVILSCARLSLFRRIADIGVPFVTAVIQRTGSIANGWLKEVHRDWDWLCEHTKQSLPAFLDLEGVHMFITAVSANAWKKMLKRARTAHLSLQRIQADREALGRFQRTVFKQFGLDCETDEKIQEEEQWRCIHCGATFESFQAVRRHEAGAHKLKHIANRYLDGCNCRICLKSVSNSFALTSHLQWMYP